MPDYFIPPFLGALFALRSTWANSPISPDLSINDAAWSDAGYFKTEKCWVVAKNDAKFLYLALDAVADTGNDSGVGDYFWLTFDVDENRAITAGQDVNYGQYPGEPNKLLLSKYLGPNVWTGGTVPPESELRVEFGKSPKSDVPHRIYKLKIRLTEINASLVRLFTVPFTYFGFRVMSSNPAFTFDSPASFSSNFAKLHKLIFSTKPTALVGLGPVIGTVGLIPTTHIASNGKATTPPAVPGNPPYQVQVQDAAFGGVLNLIANRVTLDGLRSAAATHYQVLHAEPGSAVFVPMISAWTNYRWNGSDYVPEAYAPDALMRFGLPTAGTDYSIDDLLFQFSSYGMTPGIHSFKVKFYQADGTPVVAPEEQTLSMFIDNTLPVVNIDSITHGGVKITACAIEKIGPAPDGLQFNITANDPEGNLLSYNFYATWGDNQRVAIHSQSYSSALPSWQGQVNFVPPTSPSPWRPPASCAYSFVIDAYARTTNGYSYIGHSSYHRNLTLT